MGFLISSKILSEIKIEIIFCILSREYNKKKNELFQNESSVKTTIKFELFTGDKTDATLRLNKTL